MQHLRVIGLCRIGREPEVKTLESGTIICKFNVVTNEKYKGKETTAWNECVAFGKTGENIAKYFAKGSLIMIDGKLTLDSWEDKDGKKHNAHKIMVLGFDFTGERSEQKQDYKPSGSPPDDDDIPF